MNYSPQDRQRYQHLKAEQARIKRTKAFIDRKTGNFTPEWMVNWTEFEKIRNKYGGMPPPPLESLSAVEVVSRLLEDASNMFVSAVLTPESHQRLLDAVPPVHPVVYAHHVTMAFNPDVETFERYRVMEGQRIRVPVTGMAADDKAQAVLVGVESENDYPHITISTAEGIKPRYSNDLFTVADLQHVNVFTLEADVVIEELKPSI